MRGGVFPEGYDPAQAAAQIAREPSMNGLDLVAEVTPARTVMLAPTAGSGPTIALIDMA